LKRLNTPSPIIPLSDDLDELASETPGVVEPPLASTALPMSEVELDTESSDSASTPDVEIETSESLDSIKREATEPSTVSDDLSNSESLKASEITEAAAPIAPLAFDDLDSEVIEFVPASTESPGIEAAENPATTVASRVGIAHHYLAKTAFTLEISGYFALG
jgi:hypothetical protein